MPSRAAWQGRSRGEEGGGGAQNGEGGSDDWRSGAAVFNGDLPPGMSGQHQHNNHHHHYHHHHRDYAHQSLTQENGRRLPKDAGKEENGAMRMNGYHGGRGNQGAELNGGGSATAYAIDEGRNNGMASGDGRIGHAPTPAGAESEAELHGRQQWRKAATSRSTGGLAAGEFGVSADALAAMMKMRDAEALRRFGGVDGLFVALQVNPGIGIVTSGGGVSGMSTTAGAGAGAKAAGAGAVGAEIARRRRAFGDNTFVSPPSKRYFAFVWQAMQDLAMVVLGICAAVSFLVGFMTEGPEGLYDGIGILVSIVLVVSVSSASDYHQSRQFRALSSEKQKKAVVLRRDGVVRKAVNCDIVVGDIVLLNAGDEVPADGLLISTNTMTVNESSMTGESKAITKSSSSPFLISGTKVIEGGGVMLVIGVGMRTESGKLMAHASSGCKLNEDADAAADEEEDEDMTPLKQQLADFAVMVGKLGLLVAVLVFVVNLTHFLMTANLRNWGIEETLYILQLFSVCVTIVVVAVPEGLPLALTLTLAYAMTRMVRDKSLARHLEACETMGLVTVICSDKTGTLTTNSMEVVESCVGFGDVRKQGSVGMQPSDSSNGLPSVIDPRCHNHQPSTDRRKSSSDFGIITPLLEGLVLNNCSSGVVLRGEMSQDDGAANTRTAGRTANGLAAGDHCSNTTTCNGLSDQYTNKQQPVLSTNMLRSFMAFDGGLGNVLSMRNPTEWAIYKYGLSLARDQLDDIRCIQRNSQILKVEPFSSNKKRMGVLMRRPCGTIRAHWKGAPEVIIGMCDKVADADGICRPLGDSVIDELKSMVNSMASRSLRTLCLAYCDVGESDTTWESKGEEEIPVSLPSNGFVNNWPSLPYMPVEQQQQSGCQNLSAIPTSGLTLIALLGLHDPPRPGVGEAVAMCRKAGIRLCMLTGDSMATARAIAKQCGILDSCREQAVEGSYKNFGSCSDYVIEGSEFHRRTDVASMLQVMARSTPSHKLELVEHLQKMGEVVAVTGDGTNDGPALRAADIGLAMGNGTEVAKESADVIILDDDFRTIVKVVQWGRAVYVNIQKFVQFQLTVNIVALALNFESAVSSGETPLTAVQLLWVNLIMDTLGALALATEPPTPELMEKRPVERGSSLVNYAMWRNIIGHSIYQLAVLLIIQFKGQEMLTLLGITDAPISQQEINTVMFNTFVFCQVFNEINSREIEKVWVFTGMLKNYIFMGIMVITVFFQYLMVEKLCRFASTVPLSHKEWAFSLVIGATSLIVGVLLKLIAVPSDEVSAHTAASSPCWFYKAFSWFHKKGSLSSSHNVEGDNTNDSYHLLAQQPV